MRRALRSLSAVLIVAGALLLADGAVTLLWEEPLTSLYAGSRQGELDDRLARPEGGTLRSGPGHYPGTSLPGARGTVAIAGHRSTYGAPFRDVDEFERGDRI